MVRRSITIRAVAIALSFLAAIMTAPFSLAETFSATPMGSITAPKSVTVGSKLAPTGTTIFAGDRVASEGPALISLTGGSRIEMTKAAATLNRQGNTLFVQASEGLLRFNFVKGEVVKINAGKYTFSSAKGSAHVGQLGLNNRGEVVMYVGEGTFTALNNATGVSSEVSLDNPLIAVDQGTMKAAGAASAGAAAQGRAGGKAEGIAPLLLLLVVGLAVGGTVGGLAAAGTFDTKSP
jgi:hypothetical protein